jgi:uncharacterized protein
MKPEKPKKSKSPAPRSNTESQQPKPAESPKAKAAKKISAKSPVKSKSAAPSKKPRAPRRAVSVKVPPILLEGDAPSTPVASGPGQRYATGGTPLLEDEATELPEAYGTQRLLLVARDPHWLYAHWDLTAEQLRACNQASRDGHLIVRVFRDQPAGAPIVEQHVHPESRNWFLHVGRGGSKYVAQLGYFDRSGTWTTVATSGATITPPDSLSDDTTVRFETIPVEVPFKKLLEVVKSVVPEHQPLLEAMRELREAGHPALPNFHGRTSASAAWTPEQERALAEVVNIDEVRRVWMGSLEITELLRRSLERELASQAAAAPVGAEKGIAQPPGLFSVSSPFGGEQRRKGFWFNVNAELIIYGATEPDAAVTIGGRRIQLRKDGTFSFRFALPDGEYPLPIEAVSADGDDRRNANLEFRRATQYLGDVGRHPQDAALKTPTSANVG